MAVLITGTSGKTTERIAQLLQQADIPHVGGRGAPETLPNSMPTVPFSWLDESTFGNPFAYKFAGDDKISSIYLVPPAIPDAPAAMNSFIDYAVSEHGVRRFVLICGGTDRPGGPSMGKVWQHILEKRLDYTVLRSTWFMENLSEGSHFFTINAERRLYSACGNGKIPFLSVDDFAAVAFHALTDDKPHNRDHLVLGEELFTLDEVAAKISAAIGKNVEHVKLTPEERCHQFEEFGCTKFLAELMTWLEVRTAERRDEGVNDVVQQITGYRPLKLDQFIAENKDLWKSSVDGGWAG